MSDIDPALAWQTIQCLKKERGFLLAKLNVVMEALRTLILENERLRHREPVRPIAAEMAEEALKAVRRDET